MKGLLIIRNLKKTDGLVLNVVRRYKGSAPTIVHPTMAESFGTKIAKEDLKNLMNPIGFLNENEKGDYTGPGDNDSKQVDQNEKVDNVDADSMKEIKTSEEDFFDKDKKICKDNGKEEYGFKYTKGPEPTRYGDWEKKGRCFDF